MATSSVSPSSLIFAEMLALQAEVAFPFERPLFETPAFQSAQSVLDFGCGSAHYLRRLAETFPEKQFLAFDHDADLRLIARNNTRHLSNVQVLEPDEFESLAPGSVSAILFRLVLMHLPDRSIAYRLAQRLIAPGGCAIVVDADDSLFQMRPHAPQFLARLAAWRATHPDRQVMAKLPEEMAEAGFTQTLHLQMTVNNQFPHAQIPLGQYLLLNAEVMESPEAVKVELHSWLSLPDAYLQQGVFGHVYGCS